MTDPIDTDKIRGWIDGGVYRDDAAREDLSRLCDEVDRLRALDDPATVGLEGEASAVTALGYGAGPTVIVATDGTRLHVEDTGEHFANGGHAYHWVPVSPSVDPEEEP